LGHEALLESIASDSSTCQCKILQELGVTAADCKQGMWLIALDAAGTATDQRWHGSDAVEEIGRLLPMGAALVNAYRAMPGAKTAGDKTYAFIRDHRYQLLGKRNETYYAGPTCTDGNCR
jgi:predicted DCC family thiol-disulfide oxidoreductase YuxK